ncbi:MAG: 50S ribosomal protein L19 [Candidatus Wildermuthbacteria bacterium RIFCSPLOWO2_12_FULL_40_9]|uniref:Large ribosomal subunit protein bL19 n=1 Tax=Candidatus Wildermuthbacteria bacterium RIFCSPLOWO2_12_FULL_40_9 TaxID=1802467 RepID=A0A1G2RVZ1_9BACT|nr:MAG: 50S ribosomal protein L19 [Candidatus Wildermuthbacteria bacterium RIFCSPLOWO2_12_FULL_40_9]
MATKIEEFDKLQLNSSRFDLRPGDTVKVHEKIPVLSEGKSDKKSVERIQVFEGLIIARKHGKGISATITVRKIVAGVGVEKIFPIHAPVIEKIEIVSRGKVRRAKLFYLREAKGRKSRLKKKSFIVPASDKEHLKENNAEGLETNEKEADAITGQGAAKENNPSGENENN